MATDRDTVELEIDIKGQGAIDNLTKSTENYKKLLEHLHQDFAQGGMDADAFIKQRDSMTAAMNRQAEAIEQLKAAGNGLDTAVEGQVEALGKLKGSGGVSGQGIQGASYALQDFVTVLAGGGKDSFARALQGAANNITPMLTGLGMGAGLAGVAGLAFTAISALIKPVQTLIENMSGGGPVIKIVNEALNETARRVEELSAEIEKIQKLRPKGEGEQRKRVEEIYAEGPEKQVEMGLAAAMKNSQEAGAVMAGKSASDQTSTFKERGERIKNALANPNIFAADKAYWEKVQAQFQQELNEAFEARARQLMAEATTNPAALRRMAGLAESNPQGFPGGKNFGRQLRGATPEAIKNKEVQEEEERYTQGVREIEEAEKRDAAKQAKKRELAEAQLHHKQTDAALKRNTERIDTNEDVKEAEGRAALGVREIEEAEKRDKTKRAIKAQHEAEKAQHKAAQSHDENERHFEHFDKLPGFMGLDQAAVEYAGVPARDRPQYEQRLRRDAAQGLLQQNPNMAPDEATKRAAQFPEFLRGRYQHVEAEAVGNAQAGGISVSDVARMNGLSNEGARYNLARDQAAREAFEQSLRGMEHNNHQLQQSADRWGKAGARTTSSGTFVAGGG